MYNGEYVYKNNSSRDANGVRSAVTPLEETKGVGFGSKNVSPQDASPANFLKQQLLESKNEDRKNTYGQPLTNSEMSEQFCRWSISETASRQQNPPSKQRNSEQEPLLIDLSDEAVNESNESLVYEETPCPVPPPEKSITAEEALTFPSMPTTFSGLHLKSVAELTVGTFLNLFLKDRFVGLNLLSRLRSTQEQLMQENRYLEWKNTQALERRDKVEMAKLKEAKKHLRRLKEQLNEAQKEKFELLSKVRPENLAKAFNPAVEEKLRKSEAIKNSLLNGEAVLNECLPQYIAERKAYHIRRAKTNFITALANST
eukprot:jgi/Galph1/656/GphlegSOOS_G5347.1